MVIVSHPLGNQFVRALLQHLEERQQLQRFYTSVGFSREAGWIDGLPGFWQRELGRRRFPIPADKMRTAPMRELTRQIAGRCQWGTLLKHETGWASPDAVYRAMDRCVTAALPKEAKQGNFRTLYAYEDGALHSFRVAQKLGVRRVYEITIGHYATAQKILREEAEISPQFAATIEGLQDSESKLRRKDEELALAEQVIACSDFVKSTLISAGCPASKIRVVQYGSPDYTSPPALNAVPEAKPLRLLFVGRVGQRKGFGYLMQALEKIPIKEVELTVVGEMVSDPQVWSSYRERFVYHRSMPHAELMWLMRQSDLLVLPTLFEGQALVILEAMKMGVPVLTTPNSGATNLITDGLNGLLVPIRSAVALEEKIIWAGQNRVELKEMGRKAHGTAEQCTWAAYATAIAEVLT